MKPVCLTSIRFNLLADVLRPGNAEDVDPDQYGEYVQSQDPITGDIIYIWVPADDIPDDPNTPNNEASHSTIPCMVRGIIEGGVRAAGTTEHWSEIYKSIELVRMFFPANYRLTKRDRVMNIRNSKGQVIWKEEEMEGAGIFKSTTFDVLGVTPVLDPFGNHVENYALLERSEIQ